MAFTMDGECNQNDQQSPGPSGVAPSLENMDLPECGVAELVVDTLPEAEANLNVETTGTTTGATSDIRDRSMHVIMPETSSCAAKVIRMVKLLDEFLSLPNTRQVLDEILTPMRKVDKKRLKKKKLKDGSDDDQDQQPLECPKILDNKDAIQGIRFIQAGRYEIFVQARGKKPYVFDWLCEQVWSIHRNQPLQNGGTETLESYETSQEMKQAIIQYAIQQAERDERITANIQNNQFMSYDNFSLIVSYDPVMAQPQHIDLLYPNFQYGLIITDNSPGTTVFVAPHSIRTVSDVKNHVWTDMSSTLSMALEQDAVVSSMLSQFGDVLCPDIQQVQYFIPYQNSMIEGEVVNENPTDKHQDTAGNDIVTGTIRTNDVACFPTGTLLSLPGSEIHAGPSSSKYRTVLFFSACPDVTNTIPYHPDTQYFAPLLCCDFVSLLWNDLCISDRVYLLNRLLDSISVTKCQHLDRHIADTKMIQFLRTVTNWDEKKKRSQYRVTKYSKYNTMNDYIEAFASCVKPIDSKTIGINVMGATMNSKNSQPTRDLVENIFSLEHQNRIEVISCPDLVAEFQGEYFPVHVLEHRPTISVPSTHTFLHEDAVGNITEGQNIVKVMLYYPIDQSWEGTVNPYTLEWKKASNLRSTTSRLFDGMNGILRDNEGIIVPCYPRCLTAVPSQDNDTILKKHQPRKKRRKSIIPYSVRPPKRVKVQKSMSAIPKAAPLDDDISLVRSAPFYENLRISDDDVLICSGYHRHVGNVKYRARIQLQLQGFVKASKDDKKKITYDTIRFVRDKGGRFLRRKEGLWVDMGDSDAYDIVLSRFCQDVKLTAPRDKNSVADTDDWQQNESTKVQKSPDSHVGTSEVNAVDVLSGRSIRKHPGNRSFVDLVKLFCSASENISVRDRLAICNSIIESVHNVNGRFLRRDDVTGLWYELDTIEAQQRCYTALRNHMR